MRRASHPRFSFKPGHGSLKAPERSLCSPWVLGALGVLACLVQPLAQAQGAGGTLPAGTVPVLRGVVGGVVKFKDAVPNAAGGKSLEIRQESLRGVVSWESFNIARDSDVTFFQTSTSASTLNRIYGNSPSVVQGALRSRLYTPAKAATATQPAQAEVTTTQTGGQLVLINQNGILFDRGAQVNAGGLVASSLNIGNENFLNALQNWATSEAFAGGYDDAGNALARRPDGTRPGNIGIGSFGSSTAPAPVIEVLPGTSIYMFAPRIDHSAGLIKAPDGQVILAAGRKVFLSQNPDLSDISLRGLVVEVEAETEGPGVNLTNLVRNAGEISADRGNVSLAALAVNQEGRISAKTAVQANGTIYLKARARTSDNPATFQGGTVTLAKGSVTEVRPDTADTNTVAESSDYTPFRGVIDVQGRTINSSGTLTATGGRVLLSASDSTDAAGARVYLDASSITSAAGAWSDVDVAKNLVSFRVTSNELKNSPDQKTGILRGATVTVDVRKDNSLLAIDGYRGTVQRTVAEKAAAGGEVNISSTGDVIQRAGATLDVSGGGYRYADAFVKTSRLLGADGRVYDIATAPQALQYTAQLDNFQRVDAKFNQTQTYSNPLGALASFQAATVEGKSGGLLNVGSARGLVLDGVLAGGVTIGSDQLTRAPRGATLRVGTGVVRTGDRIDYNPGQRIGSVYWAAAATDQLGAAFGAGTALSTDQQTRFNLGASQVFGVAQLTAEGLRETGFGTVELNSNGRIVLPAQVSLRTDAGAELSLRATQIDIAGNIRLPGGTLTVEPPPDSTGLITSELLPPDAGITVRAGAQVSVAGAWVNNAGPGGNAVGTPVPTARQVVAGGASTRSTLDGGTASFQLDVFGKESVLERGALIDVGGGGLLSGSQRLTTGAGGRLVMTKSATGQTNPDWLGATLQGFAFGNGAELTLNVGQALITANDANGTVAAATTPLRAGLFSDQGFSRVTVNSVIGTQVASGTQLNVSQKNLVLNTDAARTLESGANVARAASVQTLAPSLRNPASLTLNGGDALGIAEQTSIVTDARGQISLSAAKSLQIAGSLAAPGGSITASLRGTADPGQNDLHLTPTARLSAAGTFVATANDAGLRQGTLFNGGSITLAASRAGVRVDAGSVLDISGVNQVVDLRTTDATPGQVQQTLVGHAGTLSVRTQGNTTLAGTLKAKGGDSSAAGGSFALESIRPDELTLGAERRIVVRPDNTAVVPAAGTLDVAVNTTALAAAGFDKLRLLSENRIEFQGSNTLEFSRGVRLDAPLLDVAGNANVSLRASTVSLGQSLGPRLAPPNAQSNWLIDPVGLSPTLATRSGQGQLAVQAGELNLFGSLTLSGVQAASFDIDGDVRFIGRAGRSTTLNPLTNQAELRQTGWLHTAGNLEFKAAQLYPATRSEFTLAVANQPSGSAVANGYVLMASNGKTPGEAYSVAGSLSVQAPTVVQNGVVKAPQGRIVFNASQLLELGAQSVTSVSGLGLTALYGTTESGLNWSYNETSLSGNPASVLGSVAGDGKRIDLQAPDIAVQGGAKVDLRGGGDVLAVEFVPGSGGDNDITLANNTFAIVPKSRLGSMPYDADLLSRKDPGFGFSVTSGRDSVLYDGITIGTGSAVPAGEYALLPARFALLQDAYLVQLQTGSAFRNLQAGQTTALGNGDVVVAGHRSALGSGVRESQSVGVVVLPGVAVRKSSDYTLSGAALFAQTAEQTRAVTPAAPWDAGRALLADATRLSLNGTFLTAPGVSLGSTAARTAQVDVQAQRIAVVDAVGRSDVPENFLQLSADSLSRLNASVLLGGRRSDSAEGVRITTAAEELRVMNASSTEVKLPELILSARGNIDITAGSALRATGSTPTVSPGVIQAESTGALVRLSNGEQARVDRGVAGTSRGTVRIGDGARLSADRALLLDATQATQSTGQLVAGGSNGAGGSLAVASGLISLGQTEAASSPLGGLVLSNSDLARFVALDELVLRGYQGIDLVGAATVGSDALARLTLDTPLLRGVAAGTSPAQATVAAGTLTLANNNSAAAIAAVGAGSASLVLRGAQVVMASGAKAVAGFTETRVQAKDVLSVQGAGAFSAPGALTLQTPLLQAASLSQQVLAAVDNSAAGAPAYGALALLRSDDTAASAAALGKSQAGGQVTLEGASVALDSTVEARSGSITARAFGAGSTGGAVTLSGGARLDASGLAKDFNGSVVAASGGNVSLRAATGTVDVQAGARVDVSGAAAGGNAGRLSLQGQALTLVGQLAGSAVAGARSGTAEIDIGGWLPGQDFRAVNSSLNSGGFAQERSLRLRSGDIAVAAGTANAVAAQVVSLAADNGRIDVAGAVGTGAAAGSATVNLSAATGLKLAAGSLVQAQGSDAGARGGEVRLNTLAGNLDFDSGATIDVRAGAGGTAGGVVFGVQRNASGMVNPTSLAGRVLRSGGRTEASVDVEATRVYAGAEVGSSITTARLATWAAEHAAFVASSGTEQAARTAALRDEKGAVADARLLGGVEVRADGNLSIDADWDLSNSQWLAAAKPGTLTVRAAGNLTVRETVGAPGATPASPITAANATAHFNTQTSNHALGAGDSWNIRMTAGADLGAADAMASNTRGASGTGNLLLDGANAAVRTGTGRIDLAAAGNLGMNNVAAVIYTAGRIGAADTEANGNNRWALDGGNISLRAGGSISGPENAKNLWVTEWLRRPRQTPTAFTAGGLYATDWWSYRPRFQQAVGTLAGGDIDIRAGGDVRDLSALLPTSGRTYLDANRERQVEVTGGGNLRLSAGGNVSGGVYLVGRGQGVLEAAGNIGTTKAPQLFVMGVSSGVLPQGASIDLVAGGSVRLKSVDNPTVLSLISSIGAAGPSYGTGATTANNNEASIFYTYADNTAAGLFSKGGNISFDGAIATSNANLADLWRPYTGTTNAVVPTQSPNPPSLAMVALEGDIAGLVNSNLKIFPSPSGTTTALAGGSVLNLGLSVSDLAPSVLPSPFGNFRNARTVVNVSPAPRLEVLASRVETSRIVERDDNLPYGLVGRSDAAADFRYDIQASEGSVTKTLLQIGLNLPAASRVRAGLDISNLNMLLQNLNADEMSEVRADRGDVRGGSVGIGGPGRLLVQAGRNVQTDVDAVGNTSNPALSSARSARLTLVAGVQGDLKLDQMNMVGADGKPAAYAKLIALNSVSSQVLDFYGQLSVDADTSGVLSATSVAALAQRNPVYAGYVGLDAQAPSALVAFQAALKDTSSAKLPLTPGAERSAALALYKLLNTEADVARLVTAGSVAALANSPGGDAYKPFVALDTAYPRVFADYVNRRREGAVPTSFTPIVFSDALAAIVAQVVPTASVRRGSILTYLSELQTASGSDIDLWAPGGDIVVGLTSSTNSPGALTAAGGAIRGVLAGDFNINQGKVITAQGGDILLFTSGGSIDAGRGAKTSVTTPPPRITIDENGGRTVSFTGATGSGIQSLTSDPDGLGPLPAPKAGDVYLYAPAGAIDAGEAGIRSSGNISINAQVVRNAADIKASGSSQGVPQLQVGSLASALSSSASSTGGAKAAEETAKAAGEAARKAAASATPPPKPTILSVEVLGFGDKNCKEDDKNCFAK